MRYYDNRTERECGRQIMNPCERIKKFQVDFLGRETEKWLPSMDLLGRRGVSFK